MNDKIITQNIKSHELKYNYCNKTMKKNKLYKYQNIIL